MRKRISLNRIYRLLLKEYGEQGWWPGKTDFEIVIGAILTQNVSWSNVTTALKNLKQRGLLNPRSLFRKPDQEIAPLIRPTGYYNQKATKIKNFLHWFRKYNFSFARLKKIEPSILREQLLSINGIGPETADSILLYALLKRIFVVDAYTRRIFTRLGILTGDERYSDIQAVFHGGFQGEVQDYNEYHALIVNHGKYICKKKPICGQCSLVDYCEKNQI